MSSPPSPRTSCTARQGGSPPSLTPAQRPDYNVVVGPYGRRGAISVGPSGAAATDTAVSREDPTMMGRVEMSTAARTASDNVADAASGGTPGWVNISDSTSSPVAGDETGTGTGGRATGGPRSGIAADVASGGNTGGEQPREQSRSARRQPAKPKAMKIKENKVKKRRCVVM